MKTAYFERAGVTKGKPGSAWLEMLISGLVVYIIAAGAGLVFIMFPDATRQVFGNMRQSILQYTPRSSKPQLPVIQPAVVAEETPVKNVARPAARVRPAIAPAKGHFGVRIIDAMQPESPVRTTEPVMVSVREDRPVQTAKRRSKKPTAPAE